MQNIKLITFDADDTLWDFTMRMEKGVKAVAQKLAARLDADPHTVRELIDERVHEAFASADPHTVNYLEVRRVIFCNLLSEAGQSDDAFAEECVEFYVAERDADVMFFPDLIETLEGLSGYQLGWITNADRLPQDVGLEQYFSFAINEHTLGLRKPDPRVFQHAAELGGVQTNEILHVGDNLWADIDGIQGVGGLGVWYNYHQRSTADDVIPDYTITALKELLTIVQSNI
jgi:putative hydrolase of the HAD superfamily